jgi:hypothetical protein
LLGGFQRNKKDKYKRRYKLDDPRLAFQQFLKDDLPRIEQIIKASGYSGEFEVGEDSFHSMLKRVEDVRSKLSSGRRGHELCLLGTWSDPNDPQLKLAAAAVEKRGAWASWWSFPIAAKYQAELPTPFYLYLNTGQGKITHRLLVTDFRTSRGEEGIVTPWPEITDSSQADKRRLGPKKSQIFKTWLRASKVETLDSLLTLDDFEEFPGVARSALLNQNAFGFAYRRNGDSLTRGFTATDKPKNLILYGPPGTGKTHRIRELFARYTDEPTKVDRDAWLQDRLAEFGWRNVIAAVLAEIGRPARVPEIRNHVWTMAKIKERGRHPSSVQSTLWGYLQEHTPESNEHVKTAIRREPFIFSKTSVGAWELVPEWQELDEESAELLRIVRAGPQESLDRIHRFKVVTFHPSYTYEDFVRGIRPVPLGDTGTTGFRPVDGIFKKICDEAHLNPEKRYAIFIDEINRANIAKVFGELITLIEPDKRAEFDKDGRLLAGMAVQLPLGEREGASERPFGVPKNLDIYGTMNTADRSIALLDIALRRRFEFEEVQPDYSKVKFSIDGIEVDQLLRTINDRLEYLLDRDHRIGHAYLMHCDTLDGLKSAFERKIIPLLQEYFFDDFSRVALVLATSGHSKLIETEKMDPRSLFRNAHVESDTSDRRRFAITASNLWTAESFVGIYANAREPESVESPTV